MMPGRRSVVTGCWSNGAPMFPRGSRQKSRLLPAETELLSEKGPQAAFSN
jgi:hypothetical protein